MLGLLLPRGGAAPVVLKCDYEQTEGWRVIVCVNALETL